MTQSKPADETNDEQPLRCGGIWPNGQRCQHEGFNPFCDEHQDLLNKAAAFANKNDLVVDSLFLTEAANRAKVWFVVKADGVAYTTAPTDNQQPPQRIPARLRDQYPVELPYRRQHDGPNFSGQQPDRPRPTNQNARRRFG